LLILAKLTYYSSQPTI